MSQHDYAIADQAGLSFLADINAALAASVSQNSGATEPANTYPYMLWADTTSGWMKQRNAANTAWIDVWPLAGPAGADIASAATLVLSAATGTLVRITGTTATSAVTLNTGQTVTCIAVGAWPLTYHATNNPLPGSTSYTCAAGDIVRYHKDANGTIHVEIRPVSGQAVVASSSGKQIQPISASVGSNALTISASSLSLDFRSATLGSGTVTTISGTPSNLVISSGSTLGTVSAVESNLVVLALNNAGTIELAVINQAGAENLNESGVISTTAEGGAGAADSATVAYSATARTSVPYRVLGIIRSTQATAGTWATSPSLIQGAGAQAATAIALNAGGTAPMYACRAWVNFNGTGTVAINSSGNVSSITDNNTGDYTINFTNAMPDANYSLQGTMGATAIGSNSYMIKGYANSATGYQAGSARVECWNATASARADTDKACVAIFR